MSYPWLRFIPERDRSRFSSQQGGRGSPASRSFLDARSQTVDREQLRLLRIGLNCSLELTRETICRAAARLADGWLNAEPDAELSARLGIGRRQLRLLLEASNLEARAAEELDRARRLGLQVLTLDDDDYPEVLLQLELPPPVLYVRGGLPKGPATAIVGSRSASAIGREGAELFASALGRAGVCVVSGMARGIDSWAHRACIEAGGTSVAVLGSGLDRIKPRNHVSLAADLARRGAVISEFPLQCSPLPRNFPIRNRIIAALASKCLVIQATRRSGSLITARLALDLGRDVYAVPGGIFERLAEGTNQLIQDGAFPALHPNDVLDSNDRSQQERAPASGDPILAALKVGELLPGETVAARLGLPLGQVLARLVELEIEGRVHKRAGGRYGRRS